MTEKTKKGERGDKSREAGAAGRRQTPATGSSRSGNDPPAGRGPETQPEGDEQRRSAARTQAPTNRSEDPFERNVDADHMRDETQPDLDHPKPLQP